MKYIGLDKTGTLTKGALSPHLRPRAMSASSRVYFCEQANSTSSSSWSSRAPTLRSSCTAGWRRWRCAITIRSHAPSCKATPAVWSARRFLFGVSRRLSAQSRMHIGYRSTLPARTSCLWSTHSSGMAATASRGALTARLLASASSILSSVHGCEQRSFTVTCCEQATRTSSTLLGPRSRRRWPRPSRTSPAKGGRCSTRR
mmetsp:Transcript_32877/g.97268  ORF Transcript_32877/g.97268 Transcript_32877/m.97268 type:complete len:201 (+) Transcript_32877:2016-2618(+)